MHPQIRTTVFGQVVRSLSSHASFRYPDESDPSLSQALIQDDTASGVTPLKELSDGTKSQGPPEGHLANGSPAKTGQKEIHLVSWYGPDDPENPQNWSQNWKLLVTSQLCVLNFCVYIASSIYVPGELGVMEEFNVSETVATLGLSLFTVGYGFGPMLWSPLSEIPQVGRSSIFFWTLLPFILLQTAVGFAPNIATFLVFRALTGFCGSPCLATGGGTLSDMYPPAHVLYAICIWSSCGVLGPIFGPMIGGYVAPEKGWQWTIWVFTWMCAFVLVVMFFLLPETSAPNILYKRAKRLRRLTGDHRFRSQSEIDAAHHTKKDHFGVLTRAFTLTFSEPIVFLMDLYTGLLYGVLFIWFESFPIVFGEMYGFDIGQQGLVFLAIFVGALITIPLFLFYVKTVVVPKLMKPAFKPEMVLPPTFVGCFSLPICLFWYGWSAKQDIHWIMPVIGTGFFSIGVVTLFQSIFQYLAMSYPPADAASIFAGNALFRASFGASFPLFARSLFERLGIGPGNSLLGGIAVCFIPVTFVFYQYGEKIRHMSKTARHDI